MATQRKKQTGSRSKKKSSNQVPKKLLYLLVLLVAFALFYVVDSGEPTESTGAKTSYSDKTSQSNDFEGLGNLFEGVTNSFGDSTYSHGESVELATIPDYSTSPYVILDDNSPTFSASELTTESFEYYSDLDELGRCGYAYACVGLDTMPADDRESISSVKPSGWHNEKYDADLVDGSWVYNRCHLIAYCLTAENANKQNLITGTRYFNVEGMLPFETQVAAYVKETGNHVLYRVTPIYDGENLVASGVQMEAISVEDQGAGVQFNVYCYNVQPGITIDYATGENWLEEAS